MTELMKDQIGAPAGFAADRLCLAATPTFAAMALLSALGGGQPDTLCTAIRHASPFDGMVLMYLMMSVFSSAPWLRLILQPMGAKGDRG